MFERPDNIRLITASSAIETLALFAACLAFADIMTGVAKILGLSYRPLFGRYLAVSSFVIF